MKNIKLKDLSIFELVQLENAAKILYTKEQNEYIAFRGQLSPSGKVTYEESLKEMEKRVNRYGTVHNKIIDELGKRIENIDYE